MWKCYTTCIFLFQENKQEHKLLLQGKAGWEKGGRHFRAESEVRRQAASGAEFPQPWLPLTLPLTLSMWMGSLATQWHPSCSYDGREREDKNLCCDLSHLWAGREPKTNHCGVTPPSLVLLQHPGREGRHGSTGPCESFPWVWQAVL